MLKTIVTLLIKPLETELNPIYHLLALLGAKQLTLAG